MTVSELVVIVFLVLRCVSRCVSWCIEGVSGCPYFRCGSLVLTLANGLVLVLTLIGVGIVEVEWRKGQHGGSV